jgi:hypothetical protein
MPKQLCDDNCNSCPIIGHSNSRLLTRILNALHEQFGDSVYAVVQGHCPNMTVCYDCRTDDFLHIAGCELTQGD